MNADALFRLRRIASSGAAFRPCGVTIPPVVTPKKPGVTPVTPVTPLMRRKGKGERDSAEIEVRAGIASASVPALYLDAWARVNCQKPMHISEAEWRRALEDGGWFLYAWGTIAVELQWSAGDLFDVPDNGRPGGLVWRLEGERVGALGPDHARLGDGRDVMRGEFDRTERRRK